MEVPRHLVFPTPAAIRIVGKEIGFTESKAFTRAFYTSEQWIRSKAYQRALDPEKDRPELSVSEKIGVVAEHIVTRLGFEKGCEIVAVLKK